MIYLEGSALSLSNGNELVQMEFDPEQELTVVYRRSYPRAELRGRFARSAVLAYLADGGILPAVDAVAGAGETITGLEILENGTFVLATGRGKLYVHLLPASRVRALEFLAQMTGAKT